MSAYVVEKKTIDKVVTVIIEDLKITNLSADDLGYGLWTMNNDAVNARYGSKDEIETYTFESANDGFQNKRNFLISAYKAAQCLKYQSASLASSYRPEYELLTRAISYLSTHIVESLPEYETAEWG